MKEFVPKKTLTVQLPVDIIRKFEELCEQLKVAKSQMVKTMILERCDCVEQSK